MKLKPLLRDNKTYITSLVSAASFLLFELIAIMWVYGVRNYCRDIKAMHGFSPSWYFKVTSYQ